MAFGRGGWLSTLHHLMHGSLSAVHQEYIKVCAQTNKPRSLICNKGNSINSFYYRQTVTSTYTGKTIRESVSLLVRRIKILYNKPDLMSRNLSTRSHGSLSQRAASPGYEARAHARGFKLRLLSSLAGAGSSQSSPAFILDDLDHRGWSAVIICLRAPLACLGRPLPAPSGSGFPDLVPFFGSSLPQANTLQPSLF